MFHRTTLQISYGDLHNEIRKHHKSSDKPFNGMDVSHLLITAKMYQKEERRLRQREAARIRQQRFRARRRQEAMEQITDEPKKNSSSIHKPSSKTSSKKKLYPTGQCLLPSASHLAYNYHPPIYCHPSVQNVLPPYIISNQPDTLQKGCSAAVVPSSLNYYGKGRVDQYQTTTTKTSAAFFLPLSRTVSDDGYNHDEGDEEVIRSRENTPKLSTNEQIAIDAILTLGSSDDSSVDPSADDEGLHN